MTPEQMQMLKRTLAGVDMECCSREEIEIIRFLLRQGFCDKPLDFSKPVVYASQQGKAFLHSHEEKLDQQAKHERQQRFENKISVLSVLVPLITFVIGVFVEHFTGLVDWLISLF